MYLFKRKSQEIEQEIMTQNTPKLKEIALYITACAFHNQPFKE